jgi:uncharacterized membrane protein YagU involved in acid resistance
MMSANVVASPRLSVSRSLLLGAIGGLAGGIVFGIMMGMQNMLPMVGMLVGQENALIGFVVHMVISAFIGGTFGLIATRLPSGFATLVIVGAIYGVLWWVLGALILMPLMLGMNAMVLQIGEMQISSLVGHVVFGLLMGAAYKIASNRL